MPELEPQWWWLILAAALAVAEIIAPGIFLIWLAAAAALTGLLTLILGIQTEISLQLVTFALLSFVSVYIGRMVMRRHPTGSSDPLLNNRAARLIGETATVVEPIAEGRGRVQVGDSPWLATGPDISAGVRVRIVAVDGNRLRVEPL